LNIQKQDFLSIMLYKVYVNLYDIWVGSYVTLGTKAAQCYYISTYHWDDPCQISLHLVYEFIRIFLKNSPFWPLSGGGAIYDPTNYINAFRPLPLVCERNIFEILKISPIVVSLWTPKGTSLLICAHFNLYSPMIWFKSVQWFSRGSILNVFPYISLC